MKQSQNKTRYQNKTKTVNRILREHTSPDINVIRKLKERVNAKNPIFRLSITDYDRMCKDDKILSIIAKVLDTDKKSLKKICEKMNIFKEYINSSPETIKIKMKEQNMSILDLPTELRSKITGLFSSLLPTNYVFRNWVLNNKRLEVESLSENPNAVDYLTNNPGLINWGNLSRNPNAINLLTEKYKQEEILLENGEYNKLPEKERLSWFYLSENPKAKKLLEAKFKKERLLENYDLTNVSRRDILLYLNWRKLSANPCAINLLSMPENIGKIDWVQLSQNPNPKAVDLLKLPDNIDRLAWKGIPPENPFYNTELSDVNETDDTIEWGVLSLSRNEHTIELLRKRAEYEDTLSSTEYMRLRRPKKINWYYLSVNPAIFI
jgi:hypothetical protein